MHTREAKKAGESDERLSTLASWGDAPYFTGAERAVLALTEAGTRLADRADPVPDQVFSEAAKHYDEQALTALIVCIAAINGWNRLNVISGHTAGNGPPSGPTDLRYAPAKHVAVCLPSF
jgi:alkylhydroperoxidase family enzyme